MANPSPQPTPRQHERRLCVAPGEARVLLHGTVVSPVETARLFHGKLPAAQAVVETQCGRVRLYATGDMAGRIADFRPGDAVVVHGILCIYEWRVWNQEERQQIGVLVEGLERDAG